MAQSEKLANKTVLIVVILIAAAGLCLLSIPCLGAILFPVFSEARERARQTSCQTNLKQLHVAAIMYAQDYDNHLPRASRWMDLTAPYVIKPEPYHCPSVDDAGGFGYAMNVAVSGKTQDKILNPTSTPMLYDSANLARNATDPFTSLPNPPRHVRFNNVIYADGHTGTY